MNQAPKKLRITSVVDSASAPEQMPLIVEFAHNPRSIPSDSQLVEQTQDSDDAPPSSKRRQFKLTAHAPIALRHRKHQFAKNSPWNGLFQSDPSSQAAHASLQIDIDASQYEGSNDAKSDSSLLVVEHSVADGTCRLLPAMHFRLRPTVLKTADERIKNADEPNEEGKEKTTNPNAREAHAFSSRKHARSHERRNVARESKLPDQLVLVNVPPAAATSSGEKSSESSKSDARPMCNPTATAAEDIYPLDGLVPEAISELVYADAMRFFNDPAQAANVPALVKKHLERMKGEFEEESARCLQALFMYAQLNTMRRARIGSRGLDFSAPKALANCCDPLRRHLLEAYTCACTVGTRQKRIVTETLRQKLIAHQLLLALHASNPAFKVSLALLREDMPDSLKRQADVTKFADFLGCRLLDDHLILRPELFHLPDAKKSVSGGGGGRRKR